MKRMLATTAIALTLGVPAYAQSDETPALNEPNANGISVSNLIDRHLYLDVGGQIPAPYSGTGMRAWNELDQGTDNIATSGLTDIPETWAMVGEIDDVVIDAEGEVHALIVDAGGFLGMGETEKQVQIDNVGILKDIDDPDVYYTVFIGDRDRFELQENYVQQQALNRGMMRATQNPVVANDPIRTEQDVAWDSLTTEQVLGSAVYGENDNWVGDLSALQVSESGQLEGAIIDVGGFLGFGEKPIEISLDDIDLRRNGIGNIRAYISVTEDELEAMPAWDGAES